MFYFFLYFFSIIVLMVVANVIHELGHLVCMGLLGIRPNKPDICFFRLPEHAFDATGYVRSSDGLYHYPDGMRGIIRLVCFICGFSGGFFSSVFFFMVLSVAGFLGVEHFAFNLVLMPVIFTQLLYAVFEGVACFVAFKDCS